MNDKLKSLKEIKDIGLLVFEKDNSRDRDIEKKSDIIQGWALALLGVFIPAVIVILSYFFKDNICIYNITLGSSILAALLLIVALIFSTLSIKTQKFKGIDIQKIWNIEKKNSDNKWDYNRILEKLIKHLCSIHEIYKKITDNKAKYLKYSFRLFFIGLGFLIILIIINVVFFVF